MKNRERYVSRRNEYDLMMSILHSRSACPVERVGAPKPVCVPSAAGLAQTDCEGCIQRWLNEEEEHDKNTQSTGRDARR